jgi:hypothetical protein
LLCEPLETTANGKRLVVEDSAACQKTIQTPATTQQVLKTDGAGNLTWTNGANSTVLGKDSTGKVEFATLNSVLQAGPVNLGSQPLTTTGAISGASVTATSVTATSVTATSVTATGVVTGASAVFSANSSSNVVRITQTGSGNALLVEDSTNPDATPLVINADGRVISGSQTILDAFRNGSYNAYNVGGEVSFNGVRYTADAFGAAVCLGKSRGATIGSEVIPLLNDTIGTIEFTATDGTSYLQAASIRATIDATPGTNDMPGSLQFLTTSDSTFSPTVRIVIKASGNVGIGTTAPVNKLQVVGSFGRGAPVTKTVDFTLADTENWIIVNKGSSCTVTLPAASLWLGREFTIKVITAHTVVSASSNIVPANSATPGTAILSASAGAWATLVSDGTNWVIMANA